MTVVVDTSALIAIVADEPEREAFGLLLATSQPVMSAGSMIEALRLVQLRFGPDLLDRLDGVVQTLAIRTIAVDADQVKFAREGMLKFGKGRGASPATLNFGDLFAYALAKSLSAPLLFKGDDFFATDIEPAISVRDADG